MRYSLDKQVHISPAHEVPFLNSELFSPPSHNISVFEQRCSIGRRGRDEGAANDKWIDVKLVTPDLCASAAFPQTSRMHWSQLGELRAGLWRAVGGGRHTQPLDVLDMPRVATPTRHHGRLRAHLLWAVLQAALHASLLPAGTLVEGEGGAVPQLHACLQDWRLVVMSCMATVGPSRLHRPCRSMSERLCLQCNNRGKYFKNYHYSQTILVRGRKKMTVIRGIRTHTLGRGNQKWYPYTRVLDT